VRIEAPAEDAYVGDEVTFRISVENVGDGGATDVLVTVPLPENTDFVSAWWAASQTAQAAPLNAVVEDGEITIEVGDVAPGEDVQIDLVLKALVAGEIVVNASVTSAEITTPVVPDDVATVTVGGTDVMVPLVGCAGGLCGPVGVFPLLIVSGLMGMKHYHRRHARTRCPSGKHA
jgi:uncharacterized repeat protein (TIGR01451 family)